MSYIVQTLAPNGTVNDLELTLQQQEQLGDRVLVSFAEADVGGKRGNLALLRLLGDGETAPADPVQLEVIAGTAQQIQAHLNTLGSKLIACSGILVEGARVTVIVRR